MPNEMSARNIQRKTFSSILFQDMPIIFKNGKVHIFTEIPGIKQSILPMTSLKNSRIGRLKFSQLNRYLRTVLGVCFQTHLWGTDRLSKCAHWVRLQDCGPVIVIGTYLRAEMEECILPHCNKCRTQLGFELGYPFRLNIRQFSDFNVMACK